MCAPQVSLACRKSRFSVAMDSKGAAVSVSGTVKPQGSFITRIGSFDVDLGMEGEVCAALRCALLCTLRPFFLFIN